MRDIYLIVYHSPMFPAHWAFWIPSISDPQVGKKIHVTGDSFRGFQHEFQRNYYPSTTGRTHSLILLASVEDQFVKDVPGNREFSVDTDAADDIEKKALEIPAPGKSLRSATSTDKSAVEIKNCQTWLRDLVVALAEENTGIFPASSIDVVDEAPKN